MPFQVQMPGIHPVALQPTDPGNYAEAVGRTLTLRNLVQQRQLAEQEQQLNNEKLTAVKTANAEQQRAIADQRTIQEAMAATGGDPAKLQLSLMGKVSPGALYGLQKLHDERAKERGAVTKQQQEIDEKRRGTLSAIAGTIVDESSFRRGIQSAYERGALSQAEYDELKAAPWDATAQAHVRQLAEIGLTREQQRVQARADQAAEDTHQKAVAELPGTKADAVAKELTAAGQATAGITNQQQWDAWRKAFPAAAAEVPAQFSPQALQQAQQNGIAAKDRATLAQSAAALSETTRHNKVSEAETGRHNRAAEAHDARMEDGGTSMDDATINKLAEMFATTGQLPALGMGRQATQLRAAIMQRAAQQYPTVSFASNGAQYQANRDSLKGLQKQRDAVTAFEQTASRNLDQFLKTAKNIVDSGSPLLNTPLRMVNDKMLGSTEATAFNVARQVALTEIAKVVNNPGLSGVLSDSARHEVQELIGPNATLKQIYTAAAILKQDMANRGSAMDEQINAIQQRISGSLPSTPATPASTTGNTRASTAPKATHRFNPATGQIEAIR